MTIQSSNGPISDGSYKLSFKSSPLAAAVDTACINWNATGTEMATALTDVAGGLVDGVSVVRQGDASASSAYGYVYSVTFNGP